VGAILATIKFRGADPFSLGAKSTMSILSIY
jgi:hypothetical protein